MQYRNVVVLLVVGMMVWAGCSQQTQRPIVEKPQAPAVVTKASVPAQQPAAPAPTPMENMQQQGTMMMQKAAATAQEAINAAGQFPTVAEKVNYLMTQAQSFYNSQKFEQVVAVTQHVLGSLDANSAPAKDLLAQAQAKLQAAVQGGVQSVTNQLGTMGTQTK